MKRHVWLFTLGCMLGFGCATMPAPVNTAYLGEKTADEAKAVERIEVSVVEKKMERDTAKKDLRAAELRLKAEQARREHAGSVLAFREAEMSVLVAELDYEKAKIARKYQQKRPDQFKESDSFWKRVISPGDLVRLDAYEKHLAKQRQVMDGRKKEMDDAARLRAGAESLLPGPGK